MALQILGTFNLPQSKIRIVEIVGEGDIIIDASFNEDTGKLILTKGQDKDTKYNAKTGTANGTIAFGVVGEETDIFVAGLKSAAYTESTEYDPAGTGATEARLVQGNTRSTIKDIEDKVSNAQDVADIANELAQTAIQEILIAGKKLSKEANEITAQEIKDTLLLGAAADKEVDETISSETSTNLPTTKAIIEKVRAIISDLGNILEFKGIKSYEEIIALPDAQIGDIWVTSNGDEYICIKSNTPGAESWEKLGSTIDLSKYLTIESAQSTYATKQELTSGLNTKQNTINSSNKLSGDLISGAVAEATHAISADSATTAETATKATQDSAGNIISDTYATKSELTGLGAVTGISGENGVLVDSSNKNAVTVSLNLEDTFILYGGNATGF